jgi:hypothetical protein
MTLTNEGFSREEARLRPAYDASVHTDVLRLTLSYQYQPPLRT